MPNMEVTLPPRGNLIHWAAAHELLCEGFGGNAIEWHIRMQNGQRDQTLIMRFDSGAEMPSSQVIGGLNGVRDAYILSADLAEWLRGMSYVVRHEGDTEGREEIPVSLAVLKQRHWRNWPSIEQDIKKASTNGLDHAKAGLRGWWESKAIAWAKQKDKWKDVTDQAQKAHLDLAGLNKTVHRQER